MSGVEVGCGCSHGASGEPVSAHVHARGAGDDASRPGDGDRAVSPPVQALRALILAPIRFYQRFISPGLPRRCRYEPTCSSYAVQAIGRYGILRGLVLALWRLLRCNPFSPGGLDPVDAQTLFAEPPSRTRPSIP